MTLARKKLSQAMKQLSRRLDYFRYEKCAKIRKLSFFFIHFILTIRFEMKFIKNN